MVIGDAMDQRCTKRDLVQNHEQCSRVKQLARKGGAQLVVEVRGEAGFIIPQSWHRISERPSELNPPRTICCRSGGTPNVEKVPARAAESNDGYTLVAWLNYTQSNECNSPEQFVLEQGTSS